MRTMNIGRLNKRITFCKQMDIEDSMGQTKKELQEVATVWGSLYPIRGGEYYEAKKVDSRTTHKCYIRYRDGIDSDCYIVLKDKQYMIESVIDVDMEHKMLEIMCTEHLNGEVM